MFLGCAVREAVSLADIGCNKVDSLSAVGEQFGYPSVGRWI